jgi:hypothetical protein
MRINELLTEETLDELSLAQVGKGIGKFAGKVGTAKGNVQGAWQGAKDAYNQAAGRSAAIARRNVGRASGYDKSRARNIPGTPTDADTTTGIPADNQQQAATGVGHDSPTPASSIHPVDRTPSAPAVRSSTDIAGKLKDIWDDAMAHQSSNSGHPDVQQQIIAMAKDAGLTGRKIESVGHSRFLGIDL